MDRNAFVIPGSLVRTAARTLMIVALIHVEMEGHVQMVIIRLAARAQLHGLARPVNKVIIIWAEKVKSAFCVNHKICKG